MNFNVYISPDLLVSSALDKMVLSRHFEVYSTRFPPRRGVVMSMLVLDSSWRENMARGCVRFFWTLPVVALPGAKNTSYHDFYGIFIWLRISVGIVVEGVMTGIKYARRCSIFSLNCTRHRCWNLGLCLDMEVIWSGIDYNLFEKSGSFSFSAKS